MRSAGVDVKVDRDGIVTMRRGEHEVRGLRPYRGCAVALVLHALETWTLMVGPRRARSADSPRAARRGARNDCAGKDDNRRREGTATMNDDKRDRYKISDGSMGQHVRGGLDLAANTHVTPPRNEPFDPDESPSERLRASTARYKAHNDGVEKAQSEPPAVERDSQGHVVNAAQLYRHHAFRQEKLDAARLKLRKLQRAMRTADDAHGIEELIEVVDVILTWGVS